MKEIYNSGPVEASFFVYEDFLYYKSGESIIKILGHLSFKLFFVVWNLGVYQHVTGNYIGGHAVKILGWGVEEGTAYWLAANSWNTDWGDEGNEATVQVILDHNVVIRIF